MDVTPLTAYLQDHHAAAYAAIDLFDQVSSRHDRAEVRAAVARFRVHAATHLEALTDAMRRLGKTPSVRKQIIARYAQVGRQVITGVRLGARPTVRDLLDEEAVATALYARVLVWTALEQMQDPRLDAVRMAELVAAAQRDQAELDELRVGPRAPADS